MSRLAAVLCTLLLFSVSAALEAKGNAEKGKAKAVQKAGSQQACAECHGADGGTPTEKDRPILAGQRQHPSMRGIAASLSDKDIADLAAYYASPPGAGHK